MERIFYPIGQGAFYAERFTEEEDGINFNMVYDCGAGIHLNGTTTGHNVVRNAFSSKDEIDILFVSHLDTDHVNEIPTLLTSCKVKKVILPLVSRSKYILNILNIINTNGQYDIIIKILDDKESFFNQGNFNQGNNKPEIIEVKPSEENEERETKEIDSLKGVISSNSIIKNSKINWIYVPINYNQNNLEAKFKDELKKHSDPFWHTVDLSDDKQVCDIMKDPMKDPKKNRRAQLKKIYKKVCDINLCSLVVYSGPLDKRLWQIKSLVYGGVKTVTFPNKDVKDKPACIFTGDSDLKNMKIKNEFASYYSHVGTIQVPHHGSEDNHDISQYDKKTICPISVGENKYGHPSPYVIGDLTHNKCQVFCVTSDSNHRLTEKIKKIKLTKLRNLIRRRGNMGGVSRRING